MPVNRLRLLAVVLVSVLVAGCGGPQQPPATPGAAGTSGSAGTTPTAAQAVTGPAVVRIGWTGSPDTFNPGAAVLATSGTIFELVYDSLFQLQFDGSYTPELAENYEVSDDGKSWVFKLHPAVKFHDGTPLTAKDVVFSFNLYKSREDFPLLHTYTTYFDTIEAVDDQTVRLQLTEAIPNLESQLIYLYILPEHIWGTLAGEAVIEFPNNETIGTGPFKMITAKKDEFVQLGAVKDHYQRSPKVDEVIFQTFANQDAVVQALRAGQVDMITDVPSTSVPALRNAENVQLVTGPPLNPAVVDIFMNQVSDENCPRDAGGVCSGHPALRDRNVRLALAHATDKQQIIDVVLLGLGDPGLTLLPKGLGRWYNDTIQDYPFDIAKANQILEDAGYRDTNNDGVRELPDGSRPLEFRFNWPSSAANGPRIAELVGQTWSQIGVRTIPQALEADALTSVCCPAFDYDMILWGWGSDPDPNLLLSIHLTEEIPSGSSEAGYSNPEYDALYGQQATELDPEKRQALVWQMQEILHRDVVYIVPYYALEVQAFRSDRFKGWLTDQGRLALEDSSSLTVIEPVR